MTRITYRLDDHDAEERVTPETLLPALAIEFTMIALFARCDPYAAVKQHRIIRAVDTLYARLETLERPALLSKFTAFYELVAGSEATTIH